jgi:small subunit ribosomal protein S4
MFGLSERQFRRLYREAAKVPGQTGEIMVRFLERRLDNVIYRAGFSVNRIQARQFVGHGHFLIDGTRVTVPSYRLKPGQVIAVRPQSKDSPAFPPILMAHEKYLPPAWLKVDSKELRIEVAADPTPGEVEQSIDMRQIVEFYSRIS